MGGRDATSLVVVVVVVVVVIVLWTSSLHSTSAGEGCAKEGVGACMVHEGLGLGCFGLVFVPIVDKLIVRSTVISIISLSIARVYYILVLLMAYR